MVTVNTPHGCLVILPIPEHSERNSLFPEQNSLHPQEIAYAATLKPIRRRLWLAGRIAARKAFETLGIVYPEALLPNDRGAPNVLPPYKLSLSHKHHRAAALATTLEEGFIGVDIEDNRTLNPALQRKILTPEEIYTPEILIHFFSLKEAIYKALDPYVQRYVDFKEVELQFTPNGVTATLHLKEGPFVCTCWQTMDEKVVVSTAKVIRV